MPRVTFEPFGTVVAIAAGESIFEAGRRAGVPIPTACVAKATCGLCRVKVLGGEALLTPLNADEKRHLGNTYFISKLRLSCQARVVPAAPPDGDDGVVVLLPDAARARRP
jgi:2Fe-2S ferredoxin